MTKGKPIGINEIVIHVKNVENSCNFYTKVMGFNVIRKEDGLVWLKTGEGERAVQVLLHPNENDDVIPFGSMALSFEYDNVDQVIERAKKYNCKIAKYPKNMYYGWYALREAVIFDPNDIYIFLAQPIPINR